jgi:aspartyl-tRNA synthetase
MLYDEAMLKYGTDAPDTRFGLEISDCSDIFNNSQFKVFTDSLANGGIIRGFAVEDEGKISRKMIDDYTEYVKIFGAKGFPMFKYKDGACEGGIAKFISDKEKSALVTRFNLKKPACVFFSVDKPAIVMTTLAGMRLKIARDLNLIDTNKLNFLWVTDFPLFEYHEEDARFYAKHHPFTSPLKEHISYLDNLQPKDVDRLKAQAYDVVLNGSEIGGGSLRIFDSEVQKKMFSIMGISDDEAKEKFSFLVEALKYGAPPHGGIALGVDRIMMLLLKRNSIRDVIPFPKTQKGQCLMSGAPSPVANDQLRELSIKVVER